MAKTSILDIWQGSEYVSKAFYLQSLNDMQQVPRSH